MTGDDSVCGKNSTQPDVVMKSSCGRIPRIASFRSSVTRLPVARRGSTTGSLFVVAAILLLSAGGCATHQTIYPAAELPAQFQAQPLPDPTAISLPTPPQGRSDEIRPNYLLKVSLTAGLDKDESTTFPVRVAEDGTAQLPQIGPVRVAGLTDVQAEGQIGRALVQGELYRHPTVSVQIDERPTNNIIVVGAVKNQGPHKVLRSASCLGTAITEAGGLTEKAGTKIQITGANRKLFVDIADEKQRFVPLDDGDMVSVEKREIPPVQVIGLVAKPVDVDFPVGRPFRLNDAIAMAAGESNDLADSILILRQRRTDRA